MRIQGRIPSLRRAVDDEGEALEVIMLSRRNRKAALTLPRELACCRFRGDRVKSASPAPRTP